jgi:hypothetical protein
MGCNRFLNTLLGRSGQWYSAHRGIGVWVSVANPTTPVVVRHKGDQGQMPGPLDRRAENSLMLGAHPGAAARLYLGPV